MSVIMAANKDLAEAYKLMTELAAWKHFVKNTLDKIEEQATKDEDNIPISDLHNATAYIAEARGKRAVIKKIRNDVEFIIYGVK